MFTEKDILKAEFDVIDQMEEWAVDSCTEDANFPPIYVAGYLSGLHAGINQVRNAFLRKETDPFNPDSDDIPFSGV